MIHEEYEKLIPKINEAAREAAIGRWNSIAKPLHSLGLLEDAIVAAAGIEGTAEVELSPRAVVVMCADNGVVAEGVTQTGQEVTAIVSENIARGDASVCRMAKLAGAEVMAVDIGVARELRAIGIVQKNVRRGTGNMAEGPAMELFEAREAISAGMDIAMGLANRGVKLIALGEMGIGNTTTSSAITAMLTGADINEVTGRGAGLSDEGLLRKRSAIRRAIEVNKPNPEDALDVLQKVGGLDIAGLVGVMIGAAASRVPVLLDGFISLASALVAVRLAPSCGGYLLASHASKEPATGILVRELGLSPIICAEMCLGEGTGAVAAMPLLDMALAVYNEMRTFEDIEVPAYKKQC